MIEDKSGNLWLGTNGAGLSKYNPSDSLFSGAESFTNFSSAQGLAYDYVYSIKQDRDGDFWFGTLGQGISRFDGQSFINLSTAHGFGERCHFVDFSRQNRQSLVRYGKRTQCSASGKSEAVV